MQICGMFSSNATEERFHFDITVCFIFYFSGQCTPNPCLNNGVCKAKGKREFKCDCPKPYKGKKCERGVKKKVPSLHSFIKLHIYIYAKCKKN